VESSQEHQHHWVIAEPNGHWSAGVCKLCQTQRQFRNWLPEADFITREERSMAAQSA
jgi:hypothetical protein